MSIGRLLRLSLAPSAAADAVAGLVLGHGGAWPEEARAWWLVPASLCIYHGALAWNDWADREHDARTRPDRPIPGGRVSAGAAFALGAALMLAGIACAWIAAPTSALWMGGVAACAAAYDFAGRGPWIGPLLLGLCRAGNLGAGIAWVAAREWRVVADTDSLWPCIVYGAYVFLVSRLGRMEDGEDARPIGRRPVPLLLAAGALIVLAAPLARFGLAWSHAPAVALGAAAATGLWQAARSAGPQEAWTRARVQAAMGLCLRRLLVFAAVLVLADWSPGRNTPLLAAGVLLAGYPLAHGLRRVFPPS